MYKTVPPASCLTLLRETLECRVFYACLSWNPQSTYSSPSSVHLLLIPFICSFVHPLQPIYPILILLHPSPSISTHSLSLTHSHSLSLTLTHTHALPLPRPTKSFVYLLLLFSDFAKRHQSKPETMQSMDACPFAIAIGIFLLSTPSEDLLAVLSRHYIPA